MAHEPTKARRTRLALGRSPRRLSYERRLRLWLAGLSLPALVMVAVIAWRATRSWSLTSVSVAGFGLAWSIAGMYLFDQFMRPLQTLSNVVAAMREEDFSFRARGGRRNDSLGDLALEINALAATLQTQKASARDALTLLERVMNSLPSPVLAFDPQQRLSMANQAADQLFGLSRGRARGKNAADLGLDPVMHLDDQALYTQTPQQAAAEEHRSALSSRALPTEASALGSAATRWSVRRAGFRLQGIPHTLLVFSDVAAALREEERVAWQRLIRVLSHEINNSLTPIQSIAGSLRERIADDGDALALPEGPQESKRRPPVDRARAWQVSGGATERQPQEATDHASNLQADAVRGLRIIEERAASLNRFLQAYQQLTRLPAPSFRTVALESWLESVAVLESRVAVRLRRGPAITVAADPDQLGQLMINLIRNAAEAALQPLAPRSATAFPGLVAEQHVPLVELSWVLRAGRVLITVRDNGPGVSSGANLFVPFYTTKPNGTGVGLVLARQIAAAHQGTLTLANRTDGVSGCVAELQLPA